MSSELPTMSIGSEALLGAFFKIQFGNMLWQTNVQGDLRKRTYIASIRDSESSMSILIAAAY